MAPTKLPTRDSRPYVVILIPDTGDAVRLHQAHGDVDTAESFGRMKAAEKIFSDATSVCGR